MAGKRRPLYGVGINDADYNVFEYGHLNGKRVCTSRCPYYTRWANLLLRCYSSKWHKKQPSYKGCTVCEEWLTFSNFKAWMEEQDWEGNHLDKDLLVEGNKVYSPDMCVFVSRTVNNFIAGRLTSGACIERGVWLSKGKYVTSVSDPISKKSKAIGRFKNEREAHEAWLKAKREIADILIKQEKLKDVRVISALKNRYKDKQTSN